MGADVARDDQLIFLACSHQSVAHDQSASSGSVSGPCVLQSRHQMNEECMHLL